jgi:uncharacterized protein YbjT (DUF2867 family)
MILIAGGTGTLGRKVTALLARRDIPLRILARHEPEVGVVGASADARAPELVRGDVREPAVLERALDGVDVVVSAMQGFGGRDALGSRAVDRDGNLALISAARAAGVRRFVLLSIHGADPRHPIELFRHKWAAEEALRASGMTWTILRPTAYLETWLTLVGQPLVTTGTTRVFGSGRNPINFVSAGDVARFVEAAIVDGAFGASAVEVPGPENLTLDQLIGTVEAATGVHGRRQHLPVPMMRLVRLVTRVPNPILSAQIASAIAMNERDMTADGPGLRAGFPEIPMTSALEVARALFGAPAANAPAGSAPG